MFRFPLTVELDINSNCNYYCSYCRNNAVYGFQNISSDLSTTKIFELISECAEHHAFKIIISGGEPTIHPDFNRIVEYIHSKALAWSLITNGSLVDSNMANMLKINGCRSVYITLSGMTNETDGFYKGRKDSFTNVKRAINNLLDAGVSVLLGYLLTDKALNELDLLGEFLDKYPINCKISSVLPIGRAANKYSINRKIDKKIIDFQNKYINRITLTDVTMLPENVKCQVGEFSCVVKSNGDVIPCVSLIDSDVVAGSVKNESLYTIWNNSNLLKDLRNIPRYFESDRCKTCNLNSKCNMGCRALGYYKTGNLYAIDGRCIE